MERLGWDRRITIELDVDRFDDLSPLICRVFPDRTAVLRSEKEDGRSTATGNIYEKGMKFPCK